MRTFICIGLFLLIPASAFAKEPAAPYAKAKIDLIRLLNDAEPLKDPDVAELEKIISGNPGVNDPTFRDAKGTYVGPHIKVHGQCSKFFSIADSISEPTLFDKCKEWGWLPNSRPSL